ncbi:YbaB/EbfC family nucleoid-associated protein [Lutibaculum baratangense]|uniref:Nucleoid-associated protein N177_0426 n=1 Tax=Lutibaculum baratangense AMV1 TaxID=631454 RepID=V4RVD1_9HYPH|nr:YbaB/EbfC family nucleoid-associated protein [Lutibaculum baratangense]ESR27000.1 hypothetical protein N177_0426 [Lutibaculum baratangense AMV1]
MKDFTSMLKQARELQTRMADLQQEMERTEVDGTAGAGLVKVTLTAKGELRALTIDPSLLKPEETEVLEDLVVAAHADAKRKAEEALQEKMKELTGGLPIPPGMFPGV